MYEIYKIFISKLTMRAAIFGVKYNDSLNEFRKITKKVIKKNRVHPDDSYFDSSTTADKENLDGLYKKLNKILLRSDVAIIENTDYSNGIGFIIGKAAEMKKPVLVFFKKGEENIPSVVIRSYQESNKFEFAEYTNEKDLEEIISSFLKRARKLVNTKYLFNLTPEMARYLQWDSETSGRPMVDILRELLDTKMKSDTTWQEFDKD